MIHHNPYTIHLVTHLIGKLVYAKSHDIVTCSLRGLAGEPGEAGSVADGEKLPLAPRELGSCEVYPQNLSHNSNGMFVCVCGDGEYIIYTSQVCYTVYKKNSLHHAPYIISPYSIQHAT
ncbi:hypothetical protein EON63_23390 [archaeon]|nr:MAG: hypothetical protein EON63_23390 [archaeon]